MVFRILLRKVSAGKVTLHRASDVSDYSFVIRHNGNIVPQHREPNAGSQYSSSEDVVFDKNFVDLEQIDLAFLYKLPPGTYTLETLLPVKLVGSSAPIVVTALPVTFTVF